MIFDLLVFGGAIFWAFIAFALVTILMVTRRSEPNHRLAPAIILSMIFGALILAFCDPPGVTLTNVFIGLAAYAIGGLVWASARWFLLLRAIRDCVSQNLDLKRSELTSKLFREFGSATFPPAPSAYSSRLWFWSMFWPLDLLGEALTGPLNWLYSNFVMVFSAISRRMFDGVELPED